MEFTRQELRDLENALCYANGALIVQLRQYPTTNPLNRSVNDSIERNDSLVHRIRNELSNMVLADAAASVAKTDAHVPTTQVGTQSVQARWKPWTISWFSPERQWHVQASFADKEEARTYLKEHMHDYAHLLGGVNVVHIDDIISPK